jgi:hypothetical protein
MNREYAFAPSRTASSAACGDANCSLHDYIITSLAETFSSI